MARYGMTPALETEGGTLQHMIYTQNPVWYSTPKTWVWPMSYKCGAWAPFETADWPGLSYPEDRHNYQADFLPTPAGPPTLHNAVWWNRGQGWVISMDDQVAVYDTNFVRLSSREPVTAENGYGWRFSPYPDPPAGELVPLAHLRGFIPHSCEVITGEFGEGMAPPFPLDPGAWEHTQYFYDYGLPGNKTETHWKTTETVAVIQASDRLIPNDGSAPYWYFWAVQHAHYCPERTVPFEGYCLGLYCQSATAPAVRLWQSWGYIQNPPPYEDPNWPPRPEDIGKIAWIYGDGPAQPFVCCFPRRCGAPVLCKTHEPDYDTSHVICYHGRDEYYTEEYWGVSIDEADISELSPDAVAYYGGSNYASYLIINPSGQQVDPSGTGLICIGNVDTFGVQPHRIANPTIDVEQYPVISAAITDLGLTYLVQQTIPRRSIEHCLTYEKVMGTTPDGVTTYAPTTPSRIFSPSECRAGLPYPQDMTPVPSIEPFIRSQLGTPEPSVWLPDVDALPGGIATDGSIRVTFTPDAPCYVEWQDFVYPRGTINLIRNPSTMMRCGVAGQPVVLGTFGGDGASMGMVKVWYGDRAPTGYGYQVLLRQAIPMGGIKKPYSAVATPTATGQTYTVIFRPLGVLYEGGGGGPSYMQLVWSDTPPTDPNDFTGVRRLNADWDQTSPTTKVACARFTKTVDWGQPDAAMSGDYCYRWMTSGWLITPWLKGTIASLRPPLAASLGMVIDPVFHLLHAVYEVTGVIYHRSYPLPGGPWNDPVAVSPSTETCSRPSIAFQSTEAGHAGALIVMYDREGTTVPGLRWSHTAGQTW